MGFLHHEEPMRKGSISQPSLTTHCAGTPGRVGLGRLVGDRMVAHGQPVPPRRRTQLRACARVPSPRRRERDRERGEHDLVFRSPFHLPLKTIKPPLGLPRGAQCLPIYCLFLILYTRFSVFPLHRTSYIVLRALPPFPYFLHLTPYALLFLSCRVPPPHAQEAHQARAQHQQRARDGHRRGHGAIGRQEGLASQVAVGEILGVVVDEESGCAVDV